MVKENQLAKLSQRSFRSNVIFQTRDTDGLIQRTECSTWTTELVSNNVEMPGAFERQAAIYSIA